MKPTMLVGAPGTGKTYHLIQKILDIKPDKFAFVSFTKRAANEAKDRLRAYYKESELKYVRTIHSLCFELLGLKTTQVFTSKHLRLFGNEYGYEFHGRNPVMEDDSYFNLSDDDIEYRNMMINDAKMNVHKIADMGQRYYAYKRINHLVDFNDMILLIINRPGILPQFDLLLVDEIQDLSPLQLEFIMLLSKKSKQVIYAGDPNQMIFEWAGVDRNKYWELLDQCEVRILETNHRLTGAIATKSLDICNRQKGRYIKEIERYPNFDEQNIKYVSDTFDGFFMPDSKILILARNGYFLTKMALGLTLSEIKWSWLNDEYNLTNIKLSTIHASKGTECDNIVLITDVSPSTYDHIDEDKEHRVWYVAITRAKKKLFIFEPTTFCYYDLS